MYFFYYSDYGNTDNSFLKEKYIGYVNFNKLNLETGITPGAGTAIGKSKKIALIKCYNEFLERYSLGLNLLNQKEIMGFNIIDAQSDLQKGCYYSYGNNKIYGFNDTTGTASGQISNLIIHKAICELLEKNEMFTFWYGGKGSYILKDNEIISYIQELDFVSNEIELFVTRELSNYWTVYTINFLNQKFMGSGVACSESLEKSLKKSIQEAKIIEWQNYKNRKSSLNDISINYHKEVYYFIKDKISAYPTMRINGDLKESKLIICDWIKEIRIALIRADLDGNKTIKCISKELLNCLPIKKYIYLSKGKEITNRYFNPAIIDCILV